MKSLPKTVTRQRRGCDLNRGRSAPESSTLTTRLPSHPVHSIDAAYCWRRANVICRGLTDGDADVSGSGWDEPEEPCIGYTLALIGEYERILCAAVALSTGPGEQSAVSTNENAKVQR